MEVVTSSVDVVVTDPNWRAPLLAYLLDEVLPPNRIEAQTIDQRAKMFIAINGELYKRRPSPVWMLMKCVPTQQGKELLLEIHAGIYGHHAAHNRWSARLFASVFTGRLRCATWKNSSTHARGANSTLANPPTSTGAS
jgi:hypothetical protein